MTRLLALLLVALACCYTTATHARELIAAGEGCCRAGTRSPAAAEGPLRCRRGTAGAAAAAAAAVHEC